MAAELSGVTTLMAPQSANASSISDLSPDELAALALPMLVDLAPGAIGMDPPGGGVQGLAARVQALVQPLVGGFNALGGHLRTIFKSILPSPARNGVAPSGLGGREEDGSRPGLEQVGPPSLAAEIEDGRPELRDRVMKGEGDGLAAIPIPEPDGVVASGGGNSTRSIFVVALMAQALRQFGVRPAFPTRIAWLRRRPVE